MACFVSEVPKKLKKHQYICLTRDVCSKVLYSIEYIY